MVIRIRGEVIVIIVNLILVSKVSLIHFCRHNIIGMGNVIVMIIIIREAGVKDVKIIILDVGEDEMAVSLSLPSKVLTCSMTSVCVGRLIQSQQCA